MNPNLKFTLWVVLLLVLAGSIMYHIYNRPRTFAEEWPGITIEHPVWIDTTNMLYLDGRDSTADLPFDSVYEAGSVLQYTDEGAEWVVVDLDIDPTITMQNGDQRIEIREDSILWNGRAITGDKELVKALREFLAQQ